MEIEDRKMEMLCDPSIWTDVIRKRLRKRKEDMNVLSAVTDMAGRALLVGKIAAGEYRLSPPRTLYVDKKTGIYLSYKEAVARKFEEVRTLYAPADHLDGIVLAMVARVYNDIYGHLIHRNCRSYQRGVGVKTIVHGDILPRLRRGESGYKVDLSKYFDSVNVETLDATLRMIDSGSPVDRMLWEHFHDDRVVVNGEIEPRYMSIRQGNAMGTLLANLALKDVDEALSDMDILYCRYADDILMIGKDAERALETLKSMISKKGLRLNPKKVCRVSTDAPFDFLGCEIKGQSVDMSKESYDRIKREIRLICKPRKSVKKESREEQMKAIRRINRLLREGHAADRRVFGWERYFFSVINTPNRVRELDHYTRDHIKGVYVGRQTQHRKAKRMTDDEMLYQMGYKSITRMLMASKCGPDVYNVEMLEVK